MKLLLDQNISRLIVKQLCSAFPGTEQVFSLGLSKASDHEIWEFARINDFVIVTKDADFQDLGLIYGPPPKVVWIRCGNQSSQHILTLLLNNTSVVKAFLEEGGAACLELF